MEARERTRKNTAQSQSQPYQLPHLPRLILCFSPERMPGVSMTLMLSSTGLGSWAHTNLQGWEDIRGEPPSCPCLSGTLVSAPCQPLLPWTEVLKPGRLPVQTPSSKLDSAPVVGPGSVL